MSESSFFDIVVLPSLVYPYLNSTMVEQDEIGNALLIKQETERIEWFCPFLLIPSILD